LPRVVFYTYMLNHIVRLYPTVGTAQVQFITLELFIEKHRDKYKYEKTIQYNCDGRNVKYQYYILI